jgi:hypothetical protein
MQHDRPDSPTMEQVEKAKDEQPARRSRFLPSGDTKEQQKIMDRSGAIQKVRRHDSGPGEKDGFLSLILATVFLPLLRIFWIAGLQQTLCL